jgi:hypothetical protein
MSHCKLSHTVDTLYYICCIQLHITSYTLDISTFPKSDIGAIAVDSNISYHLHGYWFNTIITLYMLLYRGISSLQEASANVNTRALLHHPQTSKLHHPSISYFSTSLDDHTLHTAALK